MINIQTVVIQQIRNTVQAQYEIQGATEAHFNLSGLISLMEQNGGFSYQPFYHRQPTRGYMVSVVGYEKSYPLSAVTEADLNAYLVQFAEMLDNPAAFLGGWIKADTSEVFFDISVNVHDIETAVSLGIKNNQYSIFDLSTGNSIDLKDANGNYIRDLAK